MIVISFLLLECQDLRGNLESTLEKLQRDIGHLKYENNDNLYRIIFSRMEHISK